MFDIQNSPWGGVQSATALAPGVTLVSTASHGGLHLEGKAFDAIPPAVRATFINGPTWAEEDCELAIALAILHDAEIVPADQLIGTTPERIRTIARGIANDYERYACARAHLPGE